MAKVECVNPTTGGRINIDKNIYDLMYKAITKALKGGKALTYTELMDEVRRYIKTNKIDFTGSVEWYGISVKKDMEARGVIEVFEEKRKKLNRLK